MEIQRKMIEQYQEFIKSDCFKMKNKETREYKEPYKVICGICAGFISESDNPEGELGYDGCESDRDLREYLNR